MLTVPEAARLVGRNPETVRRWIREGKLPAGKVGTQHVIEEADLDDLVEEHDAVGVPDHWPKTFPSGEPIPNVVKFLHEARRGR